MFRRLEDKMHEIGDALFSGMRRRENCLRGHSFFVLSSYMDGVLKPKFLQVPGDAGVAKPLSCIWMC